MTDSPIDIGKACSDPASVFDGPEAVLHHAGLTEAQKIEILRRWEYDAAEADVAVEEGMPGGESDLLRRILLALDTLTGGIDTDKVGSSKQHGLTRAATRGPGERGERSDGDDSGE